MPRHIPNSQMISYMKLPFTALARRVNVGHTLESNVLRIAYRCIHCTMIDLVASGPLLAISARVGMRIAARIYRLSTAFGKNSIARSRCPPSCIYSRAPFDCS